MKNLEQRIGDLRAECAASVREFVRAHGAPGVPGLVVERMIYTRAGGDPLQAALECIQTERRDEEIARKQA